MPHQASSSLGHDNILHSRSRKALGVLICEPPVLYIRRNFQNKLPKIFYTHIYKNDRHEVKIAVDNIFLQHSQCDEESVVY